MTSKNKDNKLDNNENYPFVKETIIQKPKPVFRVAKNIIAMVCFGIIVGVVAAITFNTTNGIVKTFKNDLSDEEITLQEQTTESDKTSTNILDEPVSLEDYQAKCNELREVALRAEKSVVSVITSSMGTSISAFEVDNSRRVYSGVIMSIDDEIIILTGYSNIENVVSIEILFPNGDIATPIIKDYDSRTGIAILTVNSKNIDCTSITATSTNYNYTASKGTQVIYVGHPYKEENYIAYGTIGAINTMFSSTDIAMPMISASINGLSCKDGFLFDQMGALIGIYSSGISNVMSFFNIKDVNSTIYHLIKGDGINYVGINGETITDEIIENNDKNMPYGVYVTRIEKDSPAYEAGIMSGDIIVMVGSTQVKTMNDIKTFIESTNKSTQITFKVKRKGQIAYLEYKFNVTVGARS